MAKSTLRLNNLSAAQREVVVAHQTSGAFTKGGRNMERRQRRFEHCERLASRGFYGEGRVRRIKDAG